MILIGGRYILGKRIKAGSFGTVYCGRDRVTRTKVAIKLEPIDARHPQLEYESRFYVSMDHAEGFPGIYWFGNVGDYRAMVMERLGQSLEEKVREKGTLPLSVVRSLGTQLLDRLCILHGKGFVHRDLKPENFLLGVGDDRETVYIVDYGMVKKYVDQNDRHIAYREGKGLIGTVRYLSLNGHCGREQSRRDDLESLGYILVYLLRGRLAWQSYTYPQMGEMKRDMAINQICEGCPTNFADYLRYCRQLQFDETPDYRYLISLMQHQ